MQVRLFPDERTSLEQIAAQNGFIHGGKGSVAKLLRAIATGKITVEVGKYDLPMGGDFEGFRLNPNEKRNLDKIVLELNLTYGEKPSYSLFLKAIANHQATLKKILF